MELEQNDMGGEKSWKRRKQKEEQYEENNNMSQIMKLSMAYRSEKDEK